MIDLHIHILPGVDDGSPDLETSLRMADLAVQSGIEAVCLTPHCNLPGYYENYASEELYRRVNRLREAVKDADIPLEIYRGMEIFATEDLPELLKDGKVWTYNRTKYFLTEFDFQGDPDFCEEVLDRCVKAGFWPVIAHPARYFFVQDNPSIVWDWYQKGYGIQLNKESILGMYGEREKVTAYRLLRHGLVSYVSTDAHGVRRRNPDVDELREVLLNDFGREYTEMLLRENPRRVLRGKRLIGVEPIPFDEEQR